MNTLQDTMEHFQDYILKGNADITEGVVGPTIDFRQERLNAYKTSYHYRLLEILGKDFPHLQHLMGQELFEEIGRDYIHSYPSHHFSIRFFGRHVSHFLSTHPKSQPLFVEMAAFEWALEYAIDAADAPQLTFDELAGLSPESWAELTFTMHPSLQILHFFYPTVSLWQAIQTDSPAPVLDRQEKPSHWLVWRFQLQSHFRPITDEQLWMMERMQAGQPFSEICEGLTQWLSEDRVVSFAAESLRDWITEGVFSEYK